jgi:hypothetical protein
MQALAMAQADIPRRPLIDAERMHAAAGIDDRLAFFPVFFGRHSKPSCSSRTTLDYCAAV